MQLVEFGKECTKLVTFELVGHGPSNETRETTGANAAPHGPSERSPKAWRLAETYRFLPR